MKRVILSTKGLCKSFAHNGEQNHILSNLGIEIYESDFTIIMGTSGSGKSTLLYALSGMDRATAGEVWYENEDITNYSEKQLAKLRYQDFGFVFQQMHLVSNLNVFENVAVPGYLNTKVTTKKTNQRAKQLLEQMGLENALNRLPSQISGGEQQRTAIARAIINNPRIVFADEPTGALNRKNTLDVLDVLTDLNAMGQSVLMVTHDLQTALRANRILYIEDGKIIGDLVLPVYQHKDEKSRETQINAWLSSMKW